METLLEIIKLTVPPLIVFATAYFLLKRFLDSEQKKQLVELQRMNRGTMTPVRMQAYERLVLYLERIHPNNLVMRTHKAGMSARLLHGEMIRSIREEFGHNMSQQIYISNGAWEMAKNSKEECIKILNIALQNVDDTADGIKLGAVIFELCGKIEKLPSEVAIEYVKVEVQKLM